MRRRDFLRRSLMGVAATATVPSFLGKAFFGPSALAQGVGAGGPDGPIMVVVQLGGGNDSLNTVIPYTGASNATYLAARPDLAVPSDVVLPLEGDLGLHPALAGLKARWDEGELAVVNGVGYPNPNLSHFTSFDFWHSARPNEIATKGWLGRFFDHQCAGAGDAACAATAGVGFDPNSGLVFQQAGRAGGLMMRKPERFQWRDVTGGRDHGDRSNDETFRRLVALSAPGLSPADDVLAYVRRSTHDALVGSDLVAAALEEAAATGGGGSSFPATGLGRDLGHVASLIRAGLSTSVYYVNQGGYDTHASQVGDDANGHPLAGRHAELLAELDGALSAFVEEMKAQGNWQRVLLFTFSEFGRKVAQNASLGTDHGAAASLFVTGGAVNPGMFGVMPSLDPAARVKNDSLQYHIDFRRVYRTVLQNWLGVPAANISAILPSPPAGSFEPIAFV